MDTRRRRLAGIGAAYGLDCGWRCMIKMLIKLLERHVFSSCVCLLWSSSCFSWLLFVLCVRDLKVVREGSYASGGCLVSSCAEDIASALDSTHRQDASRDKDASRDMYKWQT